MPENYEPAGFRIIRPLELLNWRPVVIDETVPLETWTACPADRLKLRALAALSASGGLIIRIGLCEQCGYTGYLDRPTRSWISRYYADAWSQGAEKDTASLRKKRQPDNPARRALTSALELIRDRSRPILEIGAGYGTLLRFIQGQGFTKVMGLESSRRRAEAAAKATGLPMLAGDFEAGETQTELRKHAPFGLIIAYHVLEHTYDPGEIIAAASRLQNHGDLLVLGMPDVWSEPAMNIILFLPHLHSFSREALERILQHGGYKTVNAGFSDAQNITFIAEKTAAPSTVAATTPRNDYYQRAREKFRRELALNRLTPAGRQRYLWSKKGAAQPDIKPYRWHWRISDRLSGRLNCRSLLIEPLAARAPAGSTPLSVQFAEGLFLCIK